MLPCSGNFPRNLLLFKRLSTQGEAIGFSLEDSLRRTFLSLNSPTIHLPSRIFLSPQGKEYCINRSIPLENLLTHEGERGLGFKRSVLMAGLIQQLTAGNFITRIEAQDVEFISHRRAILDTTKLIIYGILYRRFRPIINSILLNSEMGRYLQNKNQAIGSIEGKKIRFNKEVVSNFIKRNGKFVRFVKELLLPSFSAKDNSPEEKEIVKRQIQVAWKFINMMDDEVWFFMNFMHRSEDRGEILRKIRAITKDFVEKTTIADPVAFMLMELVQYAESSHYKFLASHDHMARVRGKEIFEMLRDADFRERMKVKAKTLGLSMSIVYNFDNFDVVNDNLGKVYKDARGINEFSKTRIRASITGKAIIEENDFKQSETISPFIEAVSLVDFLQQNAESKENPMGMIYYKYLEEACHEQDVSLESIFSIRKGSHDSTALMTVIV